MNQMTVTYTLNFKIISQTCAVGRAEQWPYIYKYSAQDCRNSQGSLRRNYK